MNIILDIGVAKSPEKLSVCVNIVTLEFLFRRNKHADK